MAPFTSVWPLYLPKLITVLRRGYRPADFRRDAIAGLTVAIVALPLAMALAIASGAPPERGLHTAIVAGFLISALGGSRLQIGGPTAAFIPVVFNVIERFGYEGLILCTLLAGLMLIVAGVLRLGTLMKFMPEPVVTGFTMGIAVTIFLSQIKDLLGLPIERLPGEFLERMHAYVAHFDHVDLITVTLSLGCVAAIFVLRRWHPTWPAFLLVVTLGALAAAALALPVATIGSAFGGIPSALPTFAIPSIPFEQTAQLLPSAFTIAFLAGVESLLSAVVADGMTGGRHRSNAELVGQGVANVACALFAALPATGAIARTATNVRAGARTPIAGMLHAVFVLAFMLALAPLLAFVPLAALAAVLVVVAWNMLELEHVRHLLRGPVGDRLVLGVTFVLTVTFDLTIAIEVGVVLAAFLFMHRMSAVVAVERDLDLLERDRPDEATTSLADQRDRLPEGVVAFRIAGPLFFAVANRLDDMLDQLRVPPRVFILRMGLVPLIDASGATALDQFLERCARRGIDVLLSGVRPQPRAVLEAMGLQRHRNLRGMAPDFEAALTQAQILLANTCTAPSLASSERSHDHTAADKR